MARPNLARSPVRRPTMILNDVHIRTNIFLGINFRPAALYAVSGETFSKEGTARSDLNNLFSFFGKSHASSCPKLLSYANPDRALIEAQTLARPEKTGGDPIFTGRIMIMNRRGRIRKTAVASAEAVDGNDSGSIL